MFFVFFVFFLAKSDLAFLFLRLMSDLHLAVIPLSSLSCSLLFLVDLDSDTPTSWRVLLPWLSVVKGFLFTVERIIHRCFLLWMFGSFWIVEFIFAFFSYDVPNCRYGHSYYCTNLSNVFFFFCFCSFRVACFTCMQSSFDRMLSFHSKIFSEITSDQFQDFYQLNLSWHDNGNAHTCPWNSLWFNCPITFSSFKKRAAHVKGLKLLNPSSSLNMDILKLKLRVYTLCPCPLYNCNWNTFQ